MGRAVQSTRRSKVVKGHKRKSRGSKSKSMKAHLGGSGPVDHAQMGSEVPGRTREIRNAGDEYFIMIIVTCKDFSF